MTKRFPLMFSSWSFMISGLTFKYLIHFKLIFVHGIGYRSNFILLHVDIQFSKYHLLVLEKTVVSPIVWWLLSGFVNLKKSISLHFWKIFSLGIEFSVYFFSFNILKMYLHCLHCSKEKYDVLLLNNTYLNCLAAFKIFSLSLA